MASPQPQIMPPPVAAARPLERMAVQVTAGSLIARSFEVWWKNLGRFTVVALMREPTDWLGSWYRYRQREGTDPGKSTRGMTFDAFVRAWCSDPRPDFADVGSQERFLRPRQGVGVDRLFRYEEIETFVDFLEDRLGCEIILPRLNVSPAGATELTPETRALLKEAAADDYAMYETLQG